MEKYRKPSREVLVGGKSETGEEKEWQTHLSDPDCHPDGWVAGIDFRVYRFRI
jgi:hypothetical protein